MSGTVPHPKDLDIHVNSLIYEMKSADLQNQSIGLPQAGSTHTCLQTDCTSCDLRMTYLGILIVLILLSFSVVYCFVEL
jgi:hypothetical protein